MRNLADEHARELLVAVLAVGLIDDDDAFVLSPVFEAYCALCGLLPEQILKLRLMYCYGTLDPQEFDQRRLQRGRFDCKDPRGGDWAHWQSWGTSASA